MRTWINICVVQVLQTVSYQKMGKYAWGQGKNEFPYQQLRA